VKGYRCLYQSCFPKPSESGNGIDDLALRVSVNAGVPRAADPPLRSQMLNQLLFQRFPSLYEQTAISLLRCDMMTELADCTLRHAAPNIILYTGERPLS
jgi:hypothetical protein